MLMDEWPSKRGFNSPGFKDLSDRVNKRSATRTPGYGTSRQTAGQIAPLQFADAELRRMQSAALRGENCRIESRNSFSTADSLLPAELFPMPIAAQHEDRLLDFLPGYAIETPSITFIRHISTTGAPGPVAEGAQKPEIILNTDALTATAVKLAAHSGISWEIINDFEAFHSYANTELYKQLIDLENDTLIQGELNESSYTPDNSFTGFTGFLATPGILTYDASGDTGGSGASSLTALDAIEKAIAKLRVGSALAVPDLIVLHPTTWSAIRRTKDQYGRWMINPVPTRDQANELFGIRVLQTTQQIIGNALLIDLNKFGYVAIREPLSMRVGYDGNDFTHNILRTVAEERLTLAVTRPPAILSVSGLPTTP
jgi:HK97 family phage major capsid protein